MWGQIDFRAAYNVMDAAPRNAVLKTLPQLPSTTTNTPILSNTMQLGRGGAHLSSGSPEPGSKPGAQHSVSAPLLASPKASSPHPLPPVNQKAADPTGGRRVRPDMLSEWSSLSLSCKHLAQGYGHPGRRSPGGSGRVGLTPRPLPGRHCLLSSALILCAEAGGETPSLCLQLAFPLMPRNVWMFAHSQRPSDPQVKLGAGTTWLFSLVCFRRLLARLLQACSSTHLSSGMGPPSCA